MAIPRPSISLTQMKDLFKEEMSNGRRRERKTALRATEKGSKETKARETGGGSKSQGVTVRKTEGEGKWRW